MRFKIALHTVLGMDARAHHVVGAAVGVTRARQEVHEVASGALLEPPMLAQQIPDRVLEIVRYMRGNCRSFRRRARLFRKPRTHAPIIASVVRLVVSAR